MGVPGLVRLHVAMTAAAPEPGHPAGPYFAHRYGALRTAIRAGIVDMQGDGRARTDLDPDVLARLLIAAVDGVQLQWLIDPSTDMVEVVNALVRMITGPPSVKSAVPWTTSAWSSSPVSGTRVRDRARDASPPARCPTARPARIRVCVNRVDRAIRSAWW